MSNEIKIALNQLSKSIALSITSVLYVFTWFFFLIFYFFSTPFPIFHTPYFLPTPHFPQSVFSVHSLIIWLSHDNDELCSQSINCLVDNIFRQNVLKRSVRWVLPWIYPLACSCWWLLDCLYPPQRFQVILIAFKYLTNTTLPL